MYLPDILWFQISNHSIEFSGLTFYCFLIFMSDVGCFIFFFNSTFLQYILFMVFKFFGLFDDIFLASSNSLPFFLLFLIFISNHLSFLNFELQSLKMIFNLLIFNCIKFFFVLKHDLIADCRFNFSSLTFSTQTINHFQTFLWILFLFLKNCSFFYFQLFFLFLSNRQQFLFIAGCRSYWSIRCRSAIWSDWLVAHMTHITSIASEGVTSHSAFLITFGSDALVIHFVDHIFLENCINVSLVVCHDPFMIFKDFF